MPNEAYLQRSCPACGSADFDPSWRMASEPPAESCSFTDLISSWRGFFKDQKHFFTYRKCRVCRQVYSPRYFTPAQLNELYRQMDDNTGGLPEALMARTQKGYLDLLLRRTKISDGDYLELGPDIGLFTRALLNRSTFSHYWMVEPNLAVHPELDRLLGDRPHTLLANSDRIDGIPDEALSLAVAIHVLDHLLEPQSLLSLLWPKLRSDGWLMAVTHDGDSLVARMFRKNWPAYCLQHPQIYSPATLKNNLVQAGFTDVQIVKTVNYFPVMYLLRHFLFAAGLGRLPLPELPAWSIGLKLGNILVVGRKP